MDNQIIISGKNLGGLALDSFCQRCFWIKLHYKLPYQIFPSIFSSIDSYSKKITNIYYEKYNRIPDWLSEFGEFVKPVKSPHFTKFCFTDDETNVHIRGVTDEILQMTDNSYFIIDYKTARFTPHQDKLMPMYEVQLNSYAYIGNRTGFNPVSGIGLVYYEPDTDLKTDSIDEYLLDDGFTMPFRCNLHRVELNTDMIPELLGKVREIHDKKSPPEGLEGCGDCIKLEAIIGMLG